MNSSPLRAKNRLIAVKPKAWTPMIEADQLQKAIEGLHRCSARLAESVPIKEWHEGNDRARQSRLAPNRLGRERIPEVGR